MDWKKERATRDMCGYCIGSPPSANCDGSCFHNVNHPPEQIRKNRLFHVQEMLRRLPGERQAIIDREDDLNRELDALVTETVTAQPSMDTIAITDSHAEMDYSTFDGIMIRADMQPLILKEGLMWKHKVGDKWLFQWATMQYNYFVLNTREIRFRP